jgi:hypothetical protein
MLPYWMKKNILSNTETLFTNQSGKLYKALISE